MKISELREALLALMVEHGDLEVWTPDGCGGGYYPLNPGDVTVEVGQFWREGLPAVLLR